MINLWISRRSCQQGIHHSTVGKLNSTAHVARNKHQHSLLVHGRSVIIICKTWGETFLGNKLSMVAAVTEDKDKMISFLEHCDTDSQCFYAIITQYIPSVFAHLPLSLALISCQNPDMPTAHFTSSHEIVGSQCKHCIRCCLFCWMVLCLFLLTLFSYVVLVFSAASFYLHFFWNCV